MDLLTRLKDASLDLPLVQLESLDVMLLVRDLRKLNDLARDMLELLLEQLHLHVCFLLLLTEVVLMILSHDQVKLKQSRRLVVLTG